MSSTLFAGHYHVHNMSLALTALYRSAPSVFGCCSCGGRAILQRLHSCCSLFEYKTRLSVFLFHLHNVNLQLSCHVLQCPEKYPVERVLCFGRHGPINPVLYQKILLENVCPLVCDLKLSLSITFSPRGEICFQEIATFRKYNDHLRIEFHVYSCFLYLILDIVG